MHIFKKSLSMFLREYLLNFRNFYDVLIIFIFFIVGILIFVFSIGPYIEIYSQIGIGIIWTLLILSSNLSIQKLFQNDFDDGNLILLHISGMSFELIVIIKIISSWLFFQLPFLIILPFACLLLGVEQEKIYLIIITFIISSPILTNLSLISSTMNLLNDKNFALGSVIVLLLSIPVIIFSTSIINSTPDLIQSQVNILISILLLFLAITPWIGASCIKIAIKNK